LLKLTPLLHSPMVHLPCSNVVVLGWWCFCTLLFALGWSNNEHGLVLFSIGGGLVGPCIASWFQFGPKHSVIKTGPLGRLRPSGVSIPTPSHGRVP
jgi:hypothetical protein